MPASGQDEVSDRRLLQRAAGAFRNVVEQGASSFVIGKVLGEKFDMPVEFDDET